MLFSVIVPIYKVAAYLPQCIESVTNQRFEDFELLLIDDGSPDNSGEICDAYAAMDGRIRVIHKENGGVSDARNAGIAAAVGDYIWFLDGDDYMVETAMAAIAAIIKDNPEADLVTGSHIKDFGNQKLRTEPLPISAASLIVGRQDYLDLLQSNYWPFWAPWENIYRREIIARNSLFFDRTLTAAEDCAFFMDFVRLGEQFVLANEPLIYYRTGRAGSAMSSMSKKAILSQLTVFRDNHHLYASVDAGLRTYFANRFANIISTLHYLKDKQEIAEVVRFVRQEKSLLKDVKGKKYMLAKWIWKIFGFYNGSVLLEKAKHRTRTAKSLDD